MLTRLIGVTYIAVLMWKELLHRLTGTRREASLPTTILAGGILAGALHRHPASPTRHLAKVARPARPSLADSIMLAAGARYALRSVGGEQVRDTPYAGTMIAIGLTAPALRLMAALMAVPIFVARAARAFVRAW
jgi:hypothetical protein